MHAQRLSSHSRSAGSLSISRHIAHSQLLGASAKYVQCVPLYLSFHALVTQVQYRVEDGAGRYSLFGARQVAACCSTAAVISSTASTPTGEINPGHTSLLSGPSVLASIIDRVFTSSCGTKWRVRTYDNSDYAAVIEVQTDSFHTSNPVPFLNDLTYNNFRAEVLDALRQKTKYSDPESFQLLVAEQLPQAQPWPIETLAKGCVSDASEAGSDDDSIGAAATRNNGDDAASSSRRSSSSTWRRSSNGHGKDQDMNSLGFGAAPLVGCVEVSLMRAREVLRALPPSTTEYAYISSMCVRSSLRRRGAAQALMAAAEALAQRWRQPHLALHVYKDNVPAVEVYKRCGMRIIGEDPAWKGILGGRIRLLMYKELPLEEQQRESAHERKEQLQD